MQIRRHKYLGRTGRNARQLGICTAGRCSGAERDRLPADIGLDRFGNGTRWTIGRVKEEGCRSAATRGIRDPSEDKIVRLGLLEAAQTNPLDVTDSEAEVLVRLTLFKLELAVDAVTDEELQLVANRVKEAINKRLHIPDDDFRIWIEDTKSSLVRSIERSLARSADAESNLHVRCSSWLGVPQSCWRTLWMYRCGRLGKHYRCRSRQRKVFCLNNAISPTRFLAGCQ